MNCSECGTPVSTGAMFCGECGHRIGEPVENRSSRDGSASADDSASRDDTLSRVHSAAAVRLDRGPDDPPELVEDVACEQCGSPVGVDDIFCGECGHVSRAVADAFPRSRDTIAIDPVAMDPLTTSTGTGLGFDSLDGATRDPLADRGAASSLRSRMHRERFILQFSTGESVTVFGTGLVGRNPRPEPGEYFDQFVRVLDPTRSVSKVHLEFGQEDGSFWIRDRFSGNGSIVREPDATPFRCEPGKRYPIARGTRVDVGEQFLVVS